MNILNTCHRAAPAVLRRHPPRHVTTALLAFQLALIAIVGIPRPAGAAPGRIIAGADGGFGGHVKAFTSRSLSNTASFFAYSPSFSGGVRVAAGDVNGDGAPDIITGTGLGSSHVKAFSGRDQSELHSFLAYGPTFNGGVFVAAGDVNGDGLDDIVSGTDSGSAGHVKVFDGRTGSELRSFFAYGTSFNGGVRVATGDINGDGTVDIITGTGPGAAPHVKVFNGVNLAEIRSFFAYGVSFTGGVFVAGGDVNSDGFDDIITGTGSGASPHVKVFSGQTGAELHSFFAYEPTFTGGVRVAAGDLDGDGRAEILTAPAKGPPPRVKVFDGMTGQETANFLAYPSNFTDGVFIGAASVKAPRLEIGFDRTNQEMIQLEWPAGCVCEVEANPDVSDPRGWSVLDIRPVENGNHLIMLVPAVQKVRSFRLNCDMEAVR
jgi:FG-GAP-like repeat/FG-GAP repeat